MDQPTSGENVELNLQGGCACGGDKTKENGDWSASCSDSQVLTCNILGNWLQMSFIFSHLHGPLPAPIFSYNVEAFHFLWAPYGQ